MPEVNSPLNNAVSITPSDSTEYIPNLKAVYVGGTGDITYISLGDQTVVEKAVPVGTMLRTPMKRLKSTGTTATLLVGYY